MSTERVIIGERNGEMGMWVSKRGKSAYSTISEDLLMDTTRDIMRPVVKLFISNPVLNKTGSTGVGLAYFYGFGFQATSNGSATYSYEIPHNLGYTPLCHMSVDSAEACTPYPTLFIDSTKIRLEYSESQGYQNFLIANSGSYYLVADMPNSVTIKANFHFTLFAQRLQ